MEFVKTDQVRMYSLLALAGGNLALTTAHCIPRLTGGTLISTDALDAARDMSVVGATMTFAVGDVDETCT